MQRKRSLVILTHDNGYLSLSLLTDEKNNSVDVKLIEKSFRDFGWEVEVCKYSDVNDKGIAEDAYVLYASSEDYGLFYKDYIEDILLAFKNKNNVMLPELNFFRAHHNKAYMELLRSQFKNKNLKTIESKIFSSDRELKEYVEKHTIKYPIIVKASVGSGSAGVGIARNERELLQLGKKYSYKIYFDYYANLYRTNMFQKLKNFWRKVRKQRVVYYRKKGEGKFIIQNYIENLSGDYKILIFGKKYFVLQRLNRKDDFRASGSGLFSFPKDIDEIIEILEFAKQVKIEIKQPLLSVDIAYDGKKCHLIEFQCVSFGPYTLQKSGWHFIETENGWEKIEGKSVLEYEIAEAINDFIGVEEN